MTTAAGAFEIGGDDAAFAEFVEDSPDLVIDVELPNGRRHSSRRDLRWSAGPLLPLSAIDVPTERVEAAYARHDWTAPTVFAAEPSPGAHPL